MIRTTDEMNKNNIGTVKILFYSDCPHFVQTTQDIKAILSEEGFSADIQSVDLARAPEVEKEMPFAGSPKVLVNSKYITPAGDEFTGPARGNCRLYDYKARFMEQAEDMGGPEEIDVAVYDIDIIETEEDED